MATGSILLTPGSAIIPDGSTDNVGPAQTRLKGTQTGADVHILVLDFDGAGSVHESCYWSFIMPANYASGGSLVVHGWINSTTGNVAYMQGQVSATTAADADTHLEHALSTAAAASLTANTTEANRLITGTITLNMDSAAAADLVTIRLFRNPADASDTHTSDFRFVGAEFQYTTS